MLLYRAREIGTYPGDVDTDANPAARRSGISRDLGARHGPEGDAGGAAASRPQAAGAGQPAVAGAHLARDAGQRHVGGASVRPVPPTAGRQFLVGPAAAPTVGDLRGPDASHAAAAGASGAARRGVLAGLAPGGAGRLAVQSAQHAASHATDSEGADAARAGRLCQTAGGGVAGSRAPQSSRGRDRARRRKRMAAGAATRGAVAPADAVAGRPPLW